MFKWMITGHRGHKQKSKLNANNNSNNHRNSLNNARNKENEIPSFHNTVQNDKNCRIIHYSDIHSGEELQQGGNNTQQVEQQHQQQQQQQAQTSSSLHPQQLSFRNSRNSLLTASRDTLNDSNEYTTLETLQAQRNQEIKESTTEKSISETTEQTPPPVPYSRPPLPTAIGSQPNLHQCLPSQELPLYLNGHSHLGPPLQTPGTCTLPRRSVAKEPPESRFRSPSNPAPTSRQPPPYSRHQPPEPFNRIRRPCQPPPPPRVPYGSLQKLEQKQQQQFHLEPRQLQNEQKNSPQNVQHQNHLQHQQQQHLQQSQHQQSQQQQPQQQHQQQQQQQNSKEYDNSTKSQNSQSTELEFRSQCHHPSDPWEPQLLQANSNNLRVLPLEPLHSQAANPSKSIEDLLNASRVPLNTCNQPTFNNKYCSELSFQTQSKNEVLSSDSTYPASLNTSKKGETNVNSQTFHSPLNYEDYILGVNANQRDLRRVPLVQMKTPELITFKPSKEPCQRHCNSSSTQDTINHVRFVNKQTDQNVTDSSNIRSQIQTRGLASNQNYVNEEELYICEENNIEKINDFKENQKTNSNLKNDSEKEIFTNTRSEACGADTLEVRDYQTFTERKDQAIEGHEGDTFEDLELEERRKGDGCTSTSSSTSSSWMEWTQQLQAYVAWVNSQLRKMPDKHLIKDLRRDFQNGVIFADLIEILAGEKVAGITRDADSPQLRRENIDRVLQFMAAKRIRMTHITSKEITEGNLKSIMRVILALAAHYKPQSVQEGSAAANSQEKLKALHQSQISCDQNQKLGKTSQTSQQTQTQKQSSKAATHDVGVGPDTPFSPPDKTPSLIRRKITMIDEKEEPECVPLRRQPSLTNSIRPSSPTTPVYENIPKRNSLNRWAYDSLRASHKFYWASSTLENKSQNQQHLTKVGSKQYSLDDMSEDVFSNSFNTGSSRCSSLNTSVEVEDRDTKDSSFPFVTRGSQNKPAALEFWQDLQGTDRPNSSGKQFPEESEGENPFKYHTIHRISGRRKLPQIPGQSSPSSNASRENTPLGFVPSGPSSDISQVSTAEGESRISSSIQNRNGNNSDDTSREPEGRSQNSSPATSLVRGPIIESWRDLVGIEKPIVELKEYYKDQLKEKETCNPRDRTSTFGFPSGLDCGNETSGKGNEMTSEGSASNLRQEFLKQVVARRALENEKAELSRHIAQRDSLICDLRKQLIQKEKTLHLQRSHFEEAIRNIQNGKPYQPFQGESPAGRSSGREELQLVREAISALRGNFRGTDPNQHTLDTLEQAIAVLMERNASCNTTDVNTIKKEKRSMNASTNEPFTKVIYFTDRTVTPFMSCINKRLGDVTLRDFKTLFDRPGNFRFHFKSHDPEYGLVKEEILNNDDVLPGVDGKIIAWVEEDLD